MEQPGPAAGAVAQAQSGGHVQHKAVAEAPSMAFPCIVVRGFPDTWQDKDIRFVFAVYGGVSAASFGKDAQGSFARVNLKTPNNMAKAVSNLHNTQVGDGEFIEDSCVVSCEMYDETGRLVYVPSSGSMAATSSTAPLAAAPAAAEEDADGSGGGDGPPRRGRGFPQEVQERIEAGERLIEEARALRTREPRLAWRRYVAGLRGLVAEVRRLPEEDDDAADLRSRVDGYLQEADALKKQLRGGQRCEAPSEAPSGKRGRSGAAGLADVAAPWLPLLDQGEDLVGQGAELEKQRRYQEAYEKYCRGLEFFLQVMPQLGEENPQVDDLRKRVDTYLKRAESLKERLEGPGASRREASPPREQSAHDRDRDRERSRHRQRRERGDRSRSRDWERQGRSRGERRGSGASPQPISGGHHSRHHGSSGGPPPRGAPPPSAKGGPPAGPPRGASPRRSGAGGGSGSSLLVGKSKAATRR